MTQLSSRVDDVVAFADISTKSIQRLAVMVAKKTDQFDCCMEAFVRTDPISKVGTRDEKW